MPTPFGFADVTLILKHSGDPEAYNCTFGVETDLTGFTTMEHVNAIKSHFVTHLNQHLDGNVTVQVSARFGTTGPDDLVVVSDTPPVAGGRSGESLQQNSALLVQKRSDSGGRANRGRMYFPMFLTEAQVDELGKILPASVTDFQGDFTAFLSDLETGFGSTAPQPMVILHRSSSDAPTTVTSLVVDPVIATQRRRLRR